MHSLTFKKYIYIYISIFKKLTKIRILLAMTSIIVLLCYWYKLEILN